MTKSTLLRDFRGEPRNNLSLTLMLPAIFQWTRKIFKIPISVASGRSITGFCPSGNRFCSCSEPA